MITRWMVALGLDRVSLGLRLGYTNPVKAAGRVQALCDGFLDSPESIRALQRLPEALELPAQIAAHAVSATKAAVEDRKRQHQGLVRQEQETDNAAWRASCEPIL